MISNASHADVPWHEELTRVATARSFTGTPTARLIADWQRWFASRGYTTQGAQNLVWASTMATRYGRGDMDLSAPHAQTAEAV